MNFTFAKIGKSIKFAGKGYTPTGGDNEPECCLTALANNNPNDTFYIIGRSNYKTLSLEEKKIIFPFNNVIDVWSNYSTSDDVVTFIYNQLKNIKIDFSIMMIGQIGQVSIPNKINKLKDKSPGFAAVIDMTLNYTSPIYYWINETKQKYIEIITDPRYDSNQARDLLVSPAYSLSQYCYSYQRKHINSYEDQILIEDTLRVSYSDVEKLFCVNRDLPNRELNKKRESDFNIVLNEGKPSRYNLLNEWVLQHHKNVSIYGQWDNKNTTNDSRFKGSRQLNEIQTIMSRIKYTFIIPIKHGWVTSKYIEMIHAGVIPFFHPSYDTQDNLQVPEFIRPNSPDELNERIKYLDENEEFRLSLINELQDRYCKPGYYNGTFINDTIMHVIYSDFGLKYSREDIKKPERIISLDQFF